MEFCFRHEDRLVSASNHGFRVWALHVRIDSALGKGFVCRCMRVTKRSRDHPLALVTGGYEQ